MRLELRIAHGFAALMLATAPALAQSPSAASPSATDPAGHSSAAKPAGSEQPTPLTPQQRREEAAAAWTDAKQAGTRGPADVTLLDQAKLHLPADMLFVPTDQAGRMLRAWGNRVPVNPVGLVVGLRQEDDWAVVVRFVKEGYIKDDDAKDWNADDLLTSLRQGTDEANADRRSRGFPELEIVGWVTPPTYDAATHRLVWSLAQKKKETPGDAPDGINYNTYALGRDGYFSLNLLTNAKDVAHDKLSALALLGGLDYDGGKRYQDFNASTDHVAEYGLAALVGVVALKKLGLLALGAAFFVKFAKLGVLAVVGIGALISRVFRGRRNTSGGAA